jgi:hypothetical protein
MGCQLGRITDLWSPNTIRQDGDELRVGGEFALPAEEAVLLAQRVLGYPNQDEPEIPFLYDATQSAGALDGIYTVQSTEVDWAKLAAGLFSWSAVLTRVPGWQAPIFEVLSYGDLRDDDHGVSAALDTPWVGLPFDDDLLASPKAGVTFAGDGGDVRVEAPSGGYTGAIEYAIGPADFYGGAARLEMSYDGGATWKTHPGRTIQNLPMAWRLCNDLIRLYPDTSQGNGAYLILDTWHTADDTFKDKGFVLTSDANVQLGDVSTVTVVENSPCCAGVLLHYQAGSYQADVYLRVRRGAFWVEGYATSTDPTDNLGIQVTSAAAATAEIGGIRATSDDGDGNKYRIRSPRLITTDLTNGRVNTTSAGIGFPFAFGIDLHADFSAYYWAAMRHTQKAVAR